MDFETKILDSRIHKWLIKLSTFQTMIDTRVLLTPTEINHVYKQNMILNI